MNSYYGAWQVALALVTYRVARHTFRDIITHLSLDRLRRRTRAINIIYELILTSVEILELFVL